MQITTKNPEMSPLLTDLYQLTMAYGYWKTGMHKSEAVFNLYFRNNPFKGGYSIAAGLANVIEFIENFKFEYDDLDFLATLTGNDNKPLFEAEFLEYLRKMTFEGTVHAVLEGSVVFPNEPLIRVQAPICQCQLLESALLYFVNFPTLIATKASRMVQAANGEPVLEFGMRRAQNAMAASRSAYIGGVTATSNVLAGKTYGIPVKGTHAHSWVMSWNTELEAFEKYAEAMPNNCVFLVDTYDTLKGVRSAVEVGKKLRQQGQEMTGIRLDSGDLAWLSIEARRILDEGGFPDARIVASNDLDENLVTSLKNQGAKVDTWGIGTKLVTAYDQPALGGVYKLAAIREPGGEWEPRIKVSEQSAKTSIPGRLRVLRLFARGEMVGDVIAEEDTDLTRSFTFVDPADETKRTTVSLHDQHSIVSLDMLEPIFEEGRLTMELGVLTLDAARNRCSMQLAWLRPDMRRFDNPKGYRVGLERSLFEKRKSLIMAARGEAQI